MLKTCLIRFSCFIIAFSSLFCLFDGFSFTPVAADTLPEANIVEDEEIDPKYYQFVGRLYSIVTRRDTCDPSEKEEMARSLKGGITEAVIRQTEEALAARELIKGRVLEASLLTAREACEQLAEATGAEGIQTVGSRFVLYRPDPKEPKYVLPKA